MWNYPLQVLGPKLMENRKPFELRKILIVYNAAQVLFSMWLFYEVSAKIRYPQLSNTIKTLLNLQSCIGGWLNGYNLRCEPVDYSYSPKAIRVSI